MDTYQIDTRDHPVRILHIASEAVPWAKTGGLADVVGALCSHLASAGHEVTLAMPLYRSIREAGHPVGVPAGAVPVGDGWTVGVRSHDADSGVRTLFLDAPSLFDREGLYGVDGADHPDNAARFSVFVRAALAAGKALGVLPDIVHCHDWQAALAPLYLRGGQPASIRDPGAGGAGRPKVVQSLHNMAYQGVFPLSRAASVSLPAAEGDPLRCGSALNFLKGGILSADRVTTVSPRYAREIATPEYGCGLDEWIVDLEPPVVGILNGIDTDEWNPASDPHLDATYDVEDSTGKMQCKASLQAELGLAVEPETPLFGMVSRLVDQKGLSLIAELGEALVDRPAQFVFLGTGDPRYEALLTGMAERRENVAARTEFSERLAHRIEAGSDFFLMPSAFEPCGLNQMISQRYGTPPIVHRVGGLADSVTHASPEAVRRGKATGIAFDHFDAPTLSSAVDFALNLYREPSTLSAVRRSGMSRDFSWGRSGREYEALYRNTIGT
jgi:starch synthase